MCAILGYADDYPGIMFESKWNTYMSMIQNISAYMPYMVGVGNHEAHCKIPPGCHHYMANFNYYNIRFRMPLNNGTQQGHNMWYSFDYGNVHYVSISTETDFPSAFFKTRFGDQMTWLRKDLELAHANRAQVPWIIVCKFFLKRNFFFYNFNNAQWDIVQCIVLNIRTRTITLQVVTLKLFKQCLKVYCGNSRLTFILLDMFTPMNVPTKFSIHQVQVNHMKTQQQLCIL